MAKVKEITEEEYWKICNRLEQRADKLDETTPNPIHGPADFFSPSRYPCAYEIDNLPAEFKYRVTEWKEIQHFMTHRCNCELAKTAMVVCITVDKTGETNRYYYSRHKVGNCPHKEVRTSNRD